MTSSLRAGYVPPFYRIHAIRPASVTPLFVELNGMARPSGVAKLPQIARAMLNAPDGVVSVVLQPEIPAELARAFPRTFNVWAGDVRSALQRAGSGTAWRFKAEAVKDAAGEAIALILMLERRPATAAQIGLGSIFDR